MMSCLLLSFTDVSSSNSLHKILRKRDGEKLLSLSNISTRKVHESKGDGQLMRKCANIVGQTRLDRVEKVLLDVSPPSVLR